MAATKSKKKLKPVSKLFSVDSLANITYYKPNRNQLHTAHFYRKFPDMENQSLPRLKSLAGGRFVTSNDRNFADNKTLIEIDSNLNYNNNIIEIPKNSSRFVRFEFPQAKNTRIDGPAEVSFYTIENKELKRIEGKYFGSPQISNKHIELMTDKDLISYVRVWNYQKDLKIENSMFIVRKGESLVWIAMELDSTTDLTHVGICPRNDKNGIYKGMQYELFYWDDAWISLGKKLAKGDFITYSGIPDNSILWLRNLDEGVQERIFTLENGEQLWW
jgi:hypothetical protein